MKNSIFKTSAFEGKVYIYRGHNYHSIFKTSAFEGKVYICSVRMRNRRPVDQPDAG